MLLLILKQKKKKKIVQLPPISTSHYACNHYLPPWPINFIKNGLPFAKQTTALTQYYYIILRLWNPNLWRKCVHLAKFYWLHTICVQLYVVIKYLWCYEVWHHRPNIQCHRLALVLLMLPHQEKDIIALMLTIQHCFCEQNKLSVLSVYVRWALLCVSGV